MPVTKIMTKKNAIDELKQVIFTNKDDRKEKAVKILLDYINDKEMIEAYYYATGVHSHKTKIRCNKAQCLICGDVIESVNRHDYNTCKCGNVAVDGGKEYIKRGVLHLEK